MPERDIRKALKERVEEYGGEIRAARWFGRRNCPDVLCLFPAHSRYAVLMADRWNDDRMLLKGYNNWVEAKAPDGKPTDAQAREHKRMRDAGCHVNVVSTFVQLDSWLPPL